MHLLCKPRRSTEVGALDVTPAKQQRGLPIQTEFECLRSPDIALGNAARQVLALEGV